jgi:hypothetical protein
MTIQTDQHVLPFRAPVSRVPLAIAVVICTPHSTWNCDELIRRYPAMKQLRESSRLGGRLLFDGEMTAELLEGPRRDLAERIWELEHDDQLTVQYRSLTPSHDTFRRCGPWQLHEAPRGAIAALACTQGLGGESPVDIFDRLSSRRLA